MSTKIYDGHKFNGTMVDFMEAVKPLKEACMNRAVTNLLRLFERSELDSLWKYQTEMMDLKVKKQMEEAIGLDASLVVFPLYANVQLLIPFIGHRGGDPVFDKFVEADDRFEFYGYWDNTDPDEDITEDQWAKRKSGWDKALIGEGLSGVPSENGLTLNLTPGSFGVFYEANKKL